MALKRNFLQEGTEKTAFIRSFPALKFCLERGVHKNIEFIVDKFSIDLREKMHEEDIAQLRNVTYQVPANGTLIFIPGFPIPIVGFNLDKLPNFQKPGWLFTAMPYDNLKQVAKDGELRTPLEMIIHKKQYFGKTFWKKESSFRRLTDGISFSFQHCRMYLSYVYGSTADFRFEEGGFFIFPLKEVLQEKDLVLDFSNTVDRFPEVVLKDIRYDAVGPEFIGTLLVLLREQYPAWISRYKELCACFKEAEKRLEILKKMRDILNDNDSFNNIKLGDMIFFAKQFEHQERYAFREIALAQLGERFREQLNFRKEETNAALAKVKEEISKLLQKKLDKKIDELWFQHYRSQALFSFQQDFFTDILQRMGSKKSFNNLITFVEEKRFLEFTLLGLLPGMFLRGLTPWMESDALPRLARFAADERPIHFQGTIFQQGIDYFIEDNILTLGNQILVLTLMKEKPNEHNSTREYLDDLQKMEPKKLLKIFKKASAAIIHALPQIVQQQFVTSKERPCVVSIDKGVLFLSASFSDIKFIEQLVKNGIPLFSGFPHYLSSGDSRQGPNQVMDSEKVELFIHDVLGVQDLPLESERLKQSYFYLKNGRLILHEMQGYQTVEGKHSRKIFKKTNWKETIVY